MTFSEKFDYLKKTYAVAPDKEQLTENFAAQIEMTDEDCHGIFYAACFNGELSVEPYDYHDNSVSIRIDSGLLEDFLTLKRDAKDSYLAGEFSACGNLSHALMLINALKKAPAKKAPAAKKAATKKAPAKTRKPAAKKAVKEK